MRLLVAAIALAGMFAPLERLRAADDPLAYIPTDASIFVHLRAGDLLKSSIVQDVRKAAGKELDKYAAEAMEEVGLPYDAVDTVTFCFPNMPQGPGDEATFIVIVTTIKPYDKGAVLKQVRKKDAAIKQNRVELQDKFILNFASDTMFLVMHQSLEAKFVKPLMAAPPGVMSDAIKMARDKNHFIAAVDFSKLPDEFLNADPAVQPFFPLLKSKSSVLALNLKDADKKLTASLRFNTAEPAAAADAEESFKLLMKVAARGFEELWKDKDALKDIGPLLPVFKEFERALKEVKVARADARLEASITLNANLPLGEIATKALAQFRKEERDAEPINKLKQLGLAMHNYHDQNGGLPPAAICDKKGRPLLSWRVSLLPYVGENGLYDEFHLDEPWDSNHNKKLLTKIPNAYKLTGAKPDDVTTRVRVFYNNGAAFDLLQQTTFASITDGLSRTIMAVEAAEAGPWTKPDDFEFDPKAVSIEKLLHFTNDRTHVLICDGSVQTLKRGLGDKTWRLLIQKNDGEAIPDFDK